MDSSSHCCSCYWHFTSDGQHAGGGKSECYKTLQGALNLLHQTQEEDLAHVPVTCFCLNPKSISLGELYGAYNPVSNDWKDGVASKLVREAMADGNHAMKWLVFDGPVDAVWVENLNTVRPQIQLCCIWNVCKQTACPLTVYAVPLSVT